MPEITAILIEDNADYRCAVELALSNQADIRLVAQFQTAEAALRALEADNIRPAVILLDVRLPGINGIEAIPALLNICPETRILCLTQSDQEGDVVNAISLGAFGYLLKSSSVSELVAAIHAAMRGDATIDSGVARYILNQVRSRRTVEGDYTSLSGRELEVLTLLSEGLVKKEIASRLNIGYTTVDTHVGRIYGKLKVNNAPAAVNRAHRLNLLPDDPETGQ